MAGSEWKVPKDEGMRRIRERLWMVNPQWEALADELGIKIAYLRVITSRMRSGQMMCGCCLDGPCLEHFQQGKWIK